jgi:hypothetical protein
MINHKKFTIFAVAWLILGGFAGHISSAGTATKTFDFGAGGDNPTHRSHARAFSPPAGVAVAVAVNYRTTSEAPILLAIEVENSEDKILAVREVAAERTAKRLVVNLAASENTVHGCEKAWQIRIKARDGQIPPARVFGDITFSFVDPPPAVISVEGSAIALGKGANASKNIGVADSFRHPGTVTIKSSWTHNPLTQPLALKFEIVRPDGSVAKSFVGYGTNSAGSPKLDFNYVLTVADTKQNGVWKLRISNNTEHDISEINPIVTLTKKCSE